jgi:preflagellin peptidase FlaK
VTLADLLRLVAVPVLGWAAYRDVAVRRVPTRTWYPLVALGVVLLAVDAWRVFGGDGLAVGPYVRRRFLVAVVVSLVVVVPFSYLVWRLGGFGGADAKALMALAVLFPTYPSYRLVGAVLLPLPEGRTAVGAFSLTILTNTVLLAACYPFALAAWNLLSGELSPVMLFGRRVPAGSVVERHGSLLETPDGYTRRGLDVDALRMYLRWRDTTLAAVREDPGAFRDPASVPAEGNDPGDGAIDQRPVDAGEEHATDGGADEVPDETAGAVQNGEVAGEPEADAPERLPNGAAPDDEWGAAAFLDDVGWGAYGTSPEDLRDGLEVLATRETVWYSPGIPFIVPMFVGLLVALTLGDLLFYALSWLGVA